MDEKFMRQLLGEIVSSTGEAMGLVMAAVVCQLDPHRLQQDLKIRLTAVDALGRPTLAVQLATHALAAVEAEILLRQQEQTPKH